MKTEREFFVYHLEIHDLAFQAYQSGASIELILETLTDLWQDMIEAKAALWNLAEAGLIDPEAEPEDEVKSEPAASIVDAEPQPGLL